MNIKSKASLNSLSRSWPYCKRIKLQKYEYCTYWSLLSEATTAGCPHLSPLATEILVLDLGSHWVHLYTYGPGDQGEHSSDPEDLDGVGPKKILGEGEGSWGTTKSRLLLLPCRLKQECSKNNTTCLCCSNSYLTSSTTSNTRMVQGLCPQFKWLSWNVPPIKNPNSLTRQVLSEFVRSHHHF